MSTTNNEYMRDAGQTLYKLNVKDQIRHQCEVRVKNQRI